MFIVETDVAKWLITLMTMALLQQVGILRHFWDMRFRTLPFRTCRVNLKKKLGPELDKLVCKHITAIRVNGGIVNRRVTQATALRIVKAKNSDLLQEFGGSLKITKTWTNSLLSRLNFSKRKVTKAAKKLPEDFESLRNAFLTRIVSKVKQYDIPLQLVNFDETGVSTVPVSSWTMAKKGSKEIPIVGIEDKRQITAVLACTPLGELLAPQLIYQGITDRYHPRSVCFPEGWDIWHSHSHSHWSTEDTIIRYIHKILVPWASAVKKRMGLREDRRGLVINS
jgi:hypothetical protein